MIVRSKGSVVFEDMRMRSNKIMRKEIIKTLEKRDGFFCYICENDFSDENPPTIDHFIPLAKGGTWDLGNLKLAHQLCNSAKGDAMPNPDGTVNFIRRRTKLPKVVRPEKCEHCMSGRLLLIDESCSLCFSVAQPLQFPTAYKKKPKNCSHTGRDHCWMCVVGFVERI